MLSLQELQLMGVISRSLVKCVPVAAPVNKSMYKCSYQYTPVESAFTTTSEIIYI